MSNTKDKVITFAPSGSGSKTPRITLPITWLREMGITEEEREITIKFEYGKIVIEKK